MAEPGMFSNIYNGYAPTLINGSTAASDALLEAIGPELVGALGLFVLVHAVLLILNRMQWNTAVLNCVRALAVSNLLTVGEYNQWVQTTFMTTLPNWIAGATGGQIGIGVAQQFDDLRASINHMAGVLLAANAGINPALIANRLSISLGAEFSVGALWLSFVIDFLAECLMAVVVPAGAVLLLAFLFEATRRWFWGWIGKLVSLSLLELLVAIELGIALAQFRSYMATQEAISGTGIDADELIANLWGIGWVFLFGAAMMICLPAIAAAIGGSHVSNIVVTHLNMASGAMGRAVTSPATTRAASAAATSAARTARTAALGNRSLGP